MLKLYYYVLIYPKLELFAAVIFRINHGSFIKILIISVIYIYIYIYTHIYIYITFVFSQ
jgi:hypothetical protein